MQQEFTAQSHVGPDGILHLDIATGVQDIDVDVKVIVQSRQSTEPAKGKLSFEETQRRLKALETLFADPFTDAPVLSDDALTRESLYNDRRL